MQIIVQSFLCQAYFCCCRLQSVDALPVVIHLLIQPSPFSHKVSSLADSSLLNFFLLWSGVSGLGFACCMLTLLLPGEASEPDLDGCVEEKFILKIDFLFEWEEAKVDVEFPSEV